MKVTLMAGVPGSGKSTLMRALLSDSTGLKFHHGLLRGEWLRSSVLVLGIYDPEQTYPGTDRLSMAMQPQLIEFIKANAAREDLHLIAEGDRISNASLVYKLSEIGGVDLAVFSLDVEPEALSVRRKARGDTFAEKWLQGRETKNLNFRDAARKTVGLQLLVNNRPEDVEANLELLKKRAFF